MIVFRLRYPRWWFNFARELTRFGARIGAYLALLTDRYPSTATLTSPYFHELPRNVDLEPDPVVLRDVTIILAREIDGPAMPNSVRRSHASTRAIASSRRADTARANVDWGHDLRSFVTASANMAHPRVGRSHGQVARSTRSRSKSNLARPYTWRLITFNLLT
jgi:hypothetical protein